MTIYESSNGPGSRRLGITIGAGLVLLLALLVWQFGPARNTLHEAPLLAFNDIHGQPVRLGGASTPTLLTFWSTTCGPCLAEIPMLMALQAEFGQRGFEVLAVAMHYDRPDAVLELSKAKALNYRVALDPLDTTARAFGGVNKTPSHFLIGADGRILLRWVGQRPLEDIRPHIQSALPTAQSSARLRAALP